MYRKFIRTARDPIERRGTWNGTRTMAERDDVEKISRRCNIFSGENSRLKIEADLAVKKISSLQAKNVELEKALNIANDRLTTFRD